MIMLRETYRTNYQRDGYAIIPDVFTHRDVQEMKQQAYLVTSGNIRAGGYPHSPAEYAPNVSRSLIFFPALANAYLNEVRTDDRLVDIVKFFIGDNVKQANNQVYFREANDGDSFAWHRDSMFREPQYFNSDSETDYLQTLILLDDVTENNSPIEFVPGSGEWTNFQPPANLREFRRGVLSGEKLLAPRGSVMIWNGLVVHGSEKNVSNESRVTYMNGFCSSRACSSYPDYLIDGKVVPFINPKLIP